MKFAALSHRGFLAVLLQGLPGLGCGRVGGAHPEVQQRRAGPRQRHRPGAAAPLPRR